MSSLRKWCGVLGEGRGGEGGGSTERERIGQDGAFLRVDDERGREGLQCRVRREGVGTDGTQGLNIALFFRFGEGMG